MTDELEPPAIGKRLMTSLDGNAGRELSLGSTMRSSRAERGTILARASTRFGASRCATLGFQP